MQWRMNARDECVVAAGWAGAPVCVPHAHPGGPHREVTSEVTSEELIARCRAGDTEAFGELVERHSGRVYSFLRHWIECSHDAEDLTQETFLKAFLALDRCDARRPFLPWLFTIARRTAISHLRRARPMNEISEAALDSASGPDPGAQSAAADDQALLWDLARRLKPKQYEVLWLHYGEGFAVVEVARIMGLTSVHVKVLLHRARTRMARWLRARQSPEGGR